MASIASQPHRAAERRQGVSGAAAQALAAHWPEYLMEAAALGFFMLSACSFSVLLEHPSSPVRQAIPDSLPRHALGGLAMGLTLITIVHSPWGKRSGAHMNPALTLAFFLLGKIERWDAIFYGLSQFAGGILGVAIAALALRGTVADPSVNYAVTVPGPQGERVAFFAEAAISFGMMLLVLIVSNTKKLARFTGLFAGSLVAIYITLEAPLSGMSMNPARTFGSAFSAAEWRSVWIYFTAPPLGMLLAAAHYRLWRGPHAVFCAKLHHHNDQRCIFRCNYPQKGPRRSHVVQQSLRRHHHWDRRRRRHAGLQVGPFG
jgi:aquaporin Z